LSTLEIKLQATSGFVQLWLDIAAIIGCAYPGFKFDG
jgi:hypothetical protein